jgi:phosphoribosylformylglycinamidine cyclo-ligase
VLPRHLDAHVDTTSWSLPPVFAWLAQHGPVAPDELLRTFNCGVGMVAIVDAAAADAALALLAARDVAAWRLGGVGAGAGGGQVHLEGDGPRPAACSKC